VQLRQGGQKPPQTPTAKLFPLPEPRADISCADLSHVSQASETTWRGAAQKKYSTADANLALALRQL